MGDRTMDHALLIDDEPEVCLLLSHILRRSGTQCGFAHSLAQGRLALGMARYDLVILDVHLPDGLGYELVPFIRSIHPWTRTIAISALDSEGPRALHAGADVFIHKPFDRATLLSSLHDLGLQPGLEQH